MSVFPIHMVDIGARGGLNFDLSGLNQPIRISAFEPDQAECLKLEGARTNFNNAQFFYYPLALGKRSEIRTIYKTLDPACSSIYPPISELSEKYTELNCTKMISTESISVTTLDTWRITQETKYVDYLKIDTQGSELDILEGAVETLQSTSLVELEVEFSPIYQIQPLFADVDMFMRDKGFYLWRLNNLVNYSKSIIEPQIKFDRFYNSKLSSSLEPGGRLYWGHAFYLNPSAFITNSDSFYRLQGITNLLGMSDLNVSI
jgi:FkbM family methyltransferase